MIEIALLSSGRAVIISDPEIIKNNSSLRIKLTGSVPIPGDCFLSVTLPLTNTYRYINGCCFDIPFEMLSPGQIKLAIVSREAEKIWECEKIEAIELKNGDYMLIRNDRDFASRIANIIVALDKLEQRVAKQDELVSRFDARLDEIMGNYDLL